MIQCKVCNKIKTEDSFYEDSKSESGYGSTCKGCIKDEYRTMPKLIKVMYNSQVYASKKRGYVMEISREEFYGWIMVQKNFKKLFKEWEKSGWEKDMRPSVDRLDDYKPYSRDNIQLITWLENRTKAAKDRKKGINGKVNKAVRIDGVMYHSYSEAYRQLGIAAGTIRKVLSGEASRKYANYTIERI